MRLFWGSEKLVRDKGRGPIVFMMRQTFYSKRKGYDDSSASAGLVDTATYVALPSNV
jgi:hypothetical protein